MPKTHSKKINDPMGHGNQNETLVKLILRNAGFSSASEVRKIAKEENKKALQAAFEKPVDFDKPDWITEHQND